MPKAPKCMSFSYMQLRFPEAALWPGESTKVLFIAVLLPAAGKPSTLVSRTRRQPFALRGWPESCFTHNSNTVCVSAKNRVLRTRKKSRLSRGMTPSPKNSDQIGRGQVRSAGPSRGRQRRLAPARLNPQTIWRRQTASTFCRGSRAGYQYRRSPGSSRV